MNQPTADVRDSIRRGNDAWNKSFNRGDADGVAALYSDNAFVLPPGHEPIRGSAAIRDFWQGLIKAGFKDHDIELIEVEAEAGLAFVVGKWSAKGPGASGNEQSFGGAIVTVHKREDDQWKPCLHIWN
jgi:uncharacterized protein (TIGR02246 family)